MAIGTHVLSGASVLSHIGQLERTLALRNLVHISLGHLYTPGKFQHHEHKSLSALPALECKP
eukprot:scaffold209527_cov19-Tisochrysis_lutea.AAC.2